MVISVVAGVVASVSVLENFRPPTDETTIPVYPVAAQDDLGRNVTISKCPEKIVSLAPVNTEILFALGLGSKVVGVTMYCDYPPEVKEMVADGRITVIGGYANPSIEKILGLEPDLVLAVGGIQVSIVEQIEKLGLTVVVLEPKNLDDTLDDILLVGEITGHAENAQKLVENMKKRIDRITGMMKDVDYKPKVYYELWYDPLMTFGPETWVDELIGLAGGVNVFHDANTQYPEVSLESVVAHNPEVIIVNVGYMGEAAHEQIKARPGWQLTDAVKNNRIYEIDENLLIRPGPRIVDGLEALAKAIHPELFEK